MAAREDRRTELFIFPDGTAVEVLVFRTSSRTERPAPVAPRAERDGHGAPQPASPGCAPPAARSDDAAPAARAPDDEEAHVCPVCRGVLVYPMDWERRDAASWDLVLRCPDCESVRRTVAGRRVVERFNRELFLGAQSLARTAERLARSNFEEESARMVEALARDLIWPMDF